MTATAAPDRAKERTRHLAGMALRLAAAALLSGMFALAKLAADRGAHLVEILFWRQGAALPVALVTAALARGPGLSILVTARPAAHLRRMVVGLSAMACNFAAMTLLPLAEATVIGLAVPIIAVVLARLLLGERAGPTLWVAALLGFAGVVLVAGPTASRFGAPGLVVALAGALLTAWVTILIRDLGRTERPLATVFWFSLGSMLPLGLLMLRHAQPHDAATLGLLAATAALGVAAQLALTGALRLAPVALVMPMDNSALLWSALLGLWLFGTVPAASSLAGAALIVAGVCLVAWSLRPRPPAAPPAVRVRPG